MITLTPIAMVQPNPARVYTPSRIVPPKKIAESEFMDQYADHPRAVPVSFEPDGVSNPQTVTAYGFGFDCWWIIQ